MQLELEGPLVSETSVSGYELGMKHCGSGSKTLPHYNMFFLFSLLKFILWLILESSYE